MNYRWACDRFHQFVKEGMIANQTAFTTSKVHYIPCLETPSTPIKDILWALINQSAAVVTDYFPAFFLPKMTQLAAAKCPDSFNKSTGMESTQSGQPIAITPKPFFSSTYSKTVAPYLNDFPLENPLANLQHAYTPEFTESMLVHFNQSTADVHLSTIPIDHTIPPIADRKGGYGEARKRLIREQGTQKVRRRSTIW